ncbi:MAG: stage III sporulation protein AF [Lawsonibacter sp.]|nr:stage III sporulation protein AF [Lawsonibacter sp.]
MDGVREWLLAIISASILCALADSVMPSGAVKRVGKLVCGMVLLCVVLTPVAHLDLKGGQRWLEDYLAGQEARKTELNEQVNEGMKVIIETRYAAYIVDKAEEMGLTCTARVSCRVEEDGLYVPDVVQVAGIRSDVDQSRMTQLIQENLGVPLERQVYDCEEELP